MRLLVCGGRDYRDQMRVVRILDLLRPTVVIHGACRGADTLAKEWAERRNVRQLPFPANWAEEGASAGPVRNRQMLIEGKPDLVVAFPGTGGTENMVRQARVLGVPALRVEP